MARQLNGSELAEFIKERQAKAVRGLRQAYGVRPKLAIVVTVDNPVIETYMRLKKRYGADILVEVDIHRVEQGKVLEKISQLNNDDSVHGIIIQLPLQDTSETDSIVNAVKPSKDVDALGVDATLEPATPTAILWLLAGYGIDFNNKKVVLIGKGKLVGQPLECMLKQSSVNVVSCDSSDDISKAVSVADIIVTATGVPGVLSSKDIPLNAVVVDAGVAVEEGQTKGDLASDVYEREDLKITPKKGGVGPLTVCALFENVITAAKQSAGIKLNA
jgi:methylenetetrahydrofolate dehydrogenase (NADP+)/methenyltetrahydrofolate cyclohydrolase